MLSETEFKLLNKCIFNRIIYICHILDPIKQSIMIINFITFASILQKKSAIKKFHESILKELEKHFTIRFIDYTEIHKLSETDFKIIFIATGGVEKLIVQCYENLPRPTILLADGMQNSLAAALEVSSWLRNRGLKNEILHGEIDPIIERIHTLYSNFSAQQALKGTRVGVMGTPSSWLIASNVDYLLAKRRWEVEYIDISLDCIYEEFNNISDDEVGQSCANFASKALACREASPEDLIKGMRLYKAIKNICEKEQLKAFTLSCFKIIEQIGTTGCLALALLNDEGIIAGCEGDLQSIFTLLAVQAITGKTGFMANPSMINAKNREVVFAHCTIPIKMTQQYIIRNHFETESGVGIQGIMPTGEVTVIKCGGECLDEYYVSSGILIENTNYINMCRTQVRIKLNNTTDYFLKNSLGNHHIIIQGNYENAIHNFLHANSCKRVE